MNKKIQKYWWLFCISQFIHAEGVNVFHHNLWANYQHFSGQYTTAHHWYKSLLGSNCSPFAYKGYINLLFETNQHNKIIELIPSLDKRFENDPEIQLIFAIALEKNKRIEEADKKLISLSNKFKTNSEITLRTTQTYIRRKEPENALLTIDSFLNNSPRKPNNFVFYFLKSQIYVQLGQLENALKNITTCIELHPRFDKGWLLFASLHEQQGEIQKALQGYNTFLELSGKNNSVEKHLFDLMLQHKTNHQLSPFHKTYFELATSLYNKKEYRQALLNINKYLELNKDNYEAIMLKINTLAHLNGVKQIKELVKEQLKKNNDTDALWAKSIYLLHHNNIPKTTIISLLQDLETCDNNNYWFPLYTADLYMRLNKSSEAIPLLESALQRCQDPLLNSKIHYQLGLLHYEMNDFPQMLIHLEKGYELNNNFSHLNNTLAYYWATKGKNLQKAEFYLNKIISKKEKNPYFLDTQALILYKKQDYAKAQEILSSLQHSENATILLHLAKTYYKLDNRDMALTISKKAALHTTNNQEEKKIKKFQALLTS